MNLRNFEKCIPNHLHVLQIDVVDDPSHPDGLFVLLDDPSDDSVPSPVSEAVLLDEIF